MGLKKTEEEILSNQIVVTCTEEMKETVDNYSWEERRSMADWVRELIEKEIKRRKKAA